MNDPSSTSWLRAPLINIARENYLIKTCFSDLICDLEPPSGHLLVDKQPTLLWVCSQSWTAVCAAITELSLAVGKPKLPNSAILISLKRNKNLAEATVFWANVLLTQALELFLILWRCRAHVVILGLLWIKGLKSFFQTVTSLSVN